MDEIGQFLNSEVQVMLALLQDVCQHKQPSHLAPHPGYSRGRVRERQAGDRKQSSPMS